jgi:uncharacterized membrane protein YkvA (DUF1232 family)
MKWGQIGRELYALLLAVMDGETPARSKVMVFLVFAAVIGYIFSTIDLIPDVIPILGWSDDLLAIFLGTALAERFIPPAIMARCRVRAGIRIKQAAKNIQINAERTEE